uniref:Uncharacterized protein n=1 Tax=Eutreptiella gymnastica TaxID=73025 RepID=A0A7S4FF45_9EUGL
MANLTELSLADLQLDCEAVRVLAEAVMHSPTLRGLQLEMNLIEWQGGTYLGEMLAVSKHLRRLDLSCNRLRAEGISELLCTAACANTSLTSLNLSRNFCVGIDHIHGFPKNLSIMNISTNNINVPGAVKLSKILDNEDCKLQILYVQHNLIGDDGVCVICDALNRNIQLRLLDLSENMITITGVMYVVSMLSTNTTLQRLHLCRNEKINNDAWSLLETHHEQFWGLHYLDLTETAVTEKQGEHWYRERKLLVHFDDKKDSESEDSDTDEDA